MRTKIVLDIMSGDKPPELFVKGAVKAVERLNIEVILVGAEKCKKTLSDFYTGDRITLVPSYSVVTMEEDPSVVLKQKTDSSMMIAANLLKEGKADALVSAGNTGALFTIASLLIRRVKGVRRAALGTVIKLENPFIMLDVGANTDATPEILSSFGRMGHLYAKDVLGIENPRVALLNNGSEAGKGTELYIKSHNLLSQDDTINFIGNCEGRDLPADYCDVVVCDGFTGNVALKVMEGMGSFMNRNIRKIFNYSIITKLAGLITKNSTNALKKQLDHKEYGGAPFLGIAKPVIKAHGSSDEKGIYSAIKQAVAFHESDIINKMSAGILENNSGSANEKQ